MVGIKIKVRAAESASGVQLQHAPTAKALDPQLK